MPFSSSKTLFFFLLCFEALFIASNGAARQEGSDLRRLKALFEASENEIDFARAKTTIDHIIDPSQDSERVMAAIEEMIQKIQLMAGYNTTTAARLGAIRRYLYEKGPWNNYQAFQYDFSDPMGTNISSKLLSRYIETKKGNCVSMPILFMILADRLDLDVSLSTAPNHVLVQFTDPRTNSSFNIEATSGGRDARSLYPKHGGLEVSEGEDFRGWVHLILVRIVSISHIQQLFHKSCF